MWPPAHQMGTACWGSWGAGQPGWSATPPGWGRRTSPCRRRPSGMATWSSWMWWTPTGTCHPSCSASINGTWNLESSHCLSPQIGPSLPSEEISGAKNESVSLPLKCRVAGIKAAIARSGEYDRESSGGGLQRCLGGPTCFVCRNFCPSLSVAFWK